jgi:hypothetical protein
MGAARRVASVNQVDRKWSLLPLAQAVPLIAYSVWDRLLFAVYNNDRSMAIESGTWVEGGQMS